MKKVIFIISILFFTRLASYSQDFHVSHYDVSGMYMNPASTGFFHTEKANYRISLLRRSQWKSLGIQPFITNYLAADKAQSIGGRKFGLGAYLINNKAGNYNNVNFMFSGSYDIINSRYRNMPMRAARHLLSVGLQLGVMYKSIDPGSLSYDSQYSASTGNFDQALPSNENYERSSLTRFDAAYGIYYKLLDRRKKTKPFVGFSMFHLNRPLESLAGGSGRLPIRYVAQGGLEMTINEKFELRPRLLYMNQARSTEMSGGVQVFYKMSPEAPRLMAAADYRKSDAVIVSVGGNTDVYALRFSYDFSASYLSSYLNGRSAFEISLVFSPERKRRDVSVRALD